MTANSDKHFAGDVSVASGAIAHPAATVVLLRTGGLGLEVLLVRRSAQLVFHGGAWVFPGGRIDAEDYEDQPTDVIAAARRAAVREAAEETGLAIEAAPLVPFSRWITPPALPKRFDTWFFAGEATADSVQVDGGEIHEYRWVRPSECLAEQRAGTLEIPPPTWVTLKHLAAFATAEETLSALRTAPVKSFEPHLFVVPGGVCSVYREDVAYSDGRLEQAGRRHRLVMLDSGWRYECSDG